MSDDEDDSNHLINVCIYDTHSSSTILKVNSTTQSIDICRAIAHKMDLIPDEAKFYTLVLVVTAYNSAIKQNINCVRTLGQNESILEVRGTIISKLLDKYNIVDSKEVANTVRWFYKDIRTSPIDLGDSCEVSGEYSSDEEEEITHSDLAYLAKAERKGYLLKRSSKDQNLWRRWYCALTDHLWCVDINRDDPRAICIKLSGMIRYKQGTHNSSDQLQTIIINSMKQTHFFRAFNLAEHRKWIEDLHVKTNYATDNDYFSMAEVIICDEELTKSRRLHKQVSEMLDIPAVLDSIAYNTPLTNIPQIVLPIPNSNSYSNSNSSSNQLNQLSSSIQFDRSQHTGRKPPNTPSTPLQSMFVSDLAAAVDDLIDRNSFDQEEVERELAEALQSELSVNINNSNNRINNSNNPSPTSSTTSAAVSASDSLQYSLSASEKTKVSMNTPDMSNHSSSSNLSLAAAASSLTIVLPEHSSFSVSRPSFNPMDRSHRHCLLHRLHSKNKLLFHMLCFVADVQFYREMHRHDLVISSQEHYNRAIAIYIRYLVPQLIATGVNLGPHFINYYANKVTSTPPRNRANTFTVNTGKSSFSSNKGSFSSNKSSFSSTGSTHGKKSRKNKSGSGSSLGVTTSSSQSAADLLTPTKGTSSKSGCVSVAESKVPLHWGLSAAHLLKIHILLYGSEELNPWDIEKYELGDTIAAIRLQQSSAGSGTSDVDEDKVTSLKQKNSNIASRKQQQATEAPQPAASTSFWSWYTTAPADTTKTSGNHGESSSGSGAKSGSSGLSSILIDDTCVEMSPLSPDLFDDTLNQLLTVLRQ